MSRRRQKADDFKLLAAESSPEDGGDPKEFHTKPWNAPKKASRKGKQLCEQVKHALSGAFAGCADELVQSVSVFAVEPAPHTGRLLVLVSVPADLDRNAVVLAVQRAAGYLRGEAAAAISRRYAPELVFEVIGG